MRVRGRKATGEPTASLGDAAKRRFSMFKYDRSKFHIYSDSQGKLVTMEGQAYKELVESQVSPPEKTLSEVGGRYLTSILGPDNGTLVIIPFEYLMILLNGLPLGIRLEIKSLGVSVMLESKMQPNG